MLNNRRRLLTILGTPRSRKGDLVHPKVSVERTDVLPLTPSISQLSTVIAQATAPAFLLGSLAAFIAILIGRLNRIVDQSNVGKNSESHMPRLKLRATLINRALLLAVTSSIATAFLLILAFCIAFYELPHEYGVAILFVVALLAFTGSLIELAREVHIAVMDFGYLN